MTTPAHTQIFTGHEMIRHAEARIRHYVRETALEHAPDLETGDGTVWLKCEHQQVTGSFKVRGALNCVAQLSDEERARGVIACSAGNHGLGVAYAAHVYGMNATIFLPESVDASRRRELERFPVELRLVGREYGETERAALACAEESGRPFISPYNNPNVVAGQGTVAVELLRQLPEVEQLFIAVGGGGLLSGVASYAKALKPDIKIVAVSPSNSAAMFDELSGTPDEYRTFLPTLSDSTAGPIEGGSITIDLCRALIDHWILVEEEEIVGAMRYLFFEHRLVVEGAGALAVAAYLKEQQRFGDLHTALIVCGGTIDMQRFHGLVRPVR
jgi:threonine dehydratase